MNEEQKKSRELTDQEWELIQSIRNYHRAYPNGAKELEYYIQLLIDELMTRK